MAKQKKFNVIKIVKEISRERVGTVPVTKVVPDKLKRAERKTDKHPKRSLEEES